LSIAAGSYPVSRELFVYFKSERARRNPAIRAYMDELTSEQAWSEKG
jgi:phosphate transport system substrate-binding protein